MGLKVLMADDERDVLGIMAKKVEEKGYEVIPAVDGLEAWQKIQSEAPDIVLLDLNMPQMSGFEVLKALRDYPPQDKWQPVVIISARGELDDIKQGLALEAEHYLVKPCSVESVLKAIETVAKLIPQHIPPSQTDDNVELIE